MYTDIDYILKDMQRYNPKYTEKYKGYTKEELIKEFKKYYSNHLPVDLFTWSRVNEPSDRMIYREIFREHITFIQGKLMYLITSHLIFKEEPEVLVIKSFVRKSISLPICQVKLSNLGITLIFRYDFNNWLLSVDSKIDLDIDFRHTFFEGDTKLLPETYPEFPKELMFDRWKDSKTKFTVEIFDNDRLYVFIWILIDFLCYEAKLR